MTIKAWPDIWTGTGKVVKILKSFRQSEKNIRGPRFWLKPWPPVFLILLSVKTSCLWWWLPLRLSKRQSPLPTQSFSGLCSPLTIRLYYHRFSILRSFSKVWNRATSKFGTQAYLTQGLKSLTPPSPILGLLPKRFWNSSVRDDFLSSQESGQYNVLITGINY